MPRIVRWHKLFHNDDLILTFEHPKDLSNYTKLDEKEIIRRFEIFARILFNHLLTESKKDFEIRKDPESEEYEYYFKQR